MMVGFLSKAPPSVALEAIEEFQCRSNLQPPHVGTRIGTFAFSLEVKSASSSSELLAGSDRKKGRRKVLARDQPEDLEQCCQISIGKKYQNWKNYQITIKYTQ
jgi:hypothetical protein